MKIKVRTPDSITQSVLFLSAEQLSLFFFHMYIEWTSNIIFLNTFYLIYVNLQTAKRKELFLFISLFDFVKILFSKYLSIQLF